MAVEKCTAFSQYAPGRSRGPAQSGPSLKDQPKAPVADSKFQTQEAERCGVLSITVAHWLR